MNEIPNYNDLIALTNGKWWDMTFEEKTAAIAEFRKQKRQATLDSSWECLCPPVYRESDPARLPNLRKFEEVQGWEYVPKGLLLIGPSRSGKTRAVWALLKRLHFGDVGWITALGPMDLKLKVANAWRDPENAEDWIKSLRHAKLVFLDDLDTVKFTEAVEETIYDTFEYRLAHRLPVIVTVNQDGEELAKRMNANGRGAKIVERIRESHRVINFG